MCYIHIRTHTYITLNMLYVEENDKEHDNVHGNNNNNNHQNANNVNSNSNAKNSNRGPPTAASKLAKKSIRIKRRNQQNEYIILKRFDVSFVKKETDKKNKKETQRKKKRKENSAGRGAERGPLGQAVAVHRLQELREEGDEEPNP